MRSGPKRTEKILDHLLHDAFPDDGKSQPEVDLIMDPEPSGEQILAVLKPYGFRDVDSAYRNLSALASEKIRFLVRRGGVGIFWRRSLATCSRRLPTRLTLMRRLFRWSR